MNAKERDIVAYLICLADEAGVSVKSAVEELSKCDPKFWSAYDIWVKHFKADTELVEEYHRRMHDEFGPDWAQIKGTKIRGDVIWAEIVASAQKPLVPTDQP